MSPQDAPTELPGIGMTLGPALVALPFLVLAMRHAARRLPPRPARGTPFTGGEILAVVSMPFVVLLALSALLRHAPETEPSGGAVLASLAATQLVLGMAVALAVLLAARRGGGLQELGLGEPVPPAALGSILAVYVPGFFVLNVGIGSLWVRVCRLLGWEERQEILELLRHLTGWQWGVAAVIAVWVGPFVEELLFRGFLQGVLGRWMGERAGLLTTSLVFASLHGLAGLPVLFALSLFLGWLQARTRCVFVPWGAHALNNAVSLALALAASSQVEGGP